METTEELDVIEPDCDDVELILHDQDRLRIDPAQVKHLLAASPVLHEAVSMGWKTVPLGVPCASLRAATIFMAGTATYNLQPATCAYCNLQCMITMGLCIAACCGSFCRCEPEDVLDAMALAEYLCAPMHVLTWLLGFGDAYPSPVVLGLMRIASRTGLPSETLGRALLSACHLNARLSWPNVGPLPGLLEIADSFAHIARPEGACEFVRQIRRAAGDDLDVRVYVGNAPSSPYLPS